MDRSPTYLLADTLLDDGIESFVRARRSEGASWRRIALDLWEATDRKVEVTHETLRSWFPGEEPAA